MLWAKYLYPDQSQYSAAMNDDGLCPIIFRYAEILLTKAECLVELNQDLQGAMDLIDQLRLRGGHIAVDRTKYVTQAEVRELVRRERTIELAGEGVYYDDIRRWRIAENVMNADVLKYDGSRVETRTFSSKNYLWPLPQQEIDDNPNLLPNNPGWETTSTE